MSAVRARTLVQQALSLNTRSLGRRVATGASFQFLGILLRTLLTLGSTAILARLLKPADFGFIAMATVVTEFAALFGAFGFTNVLIQRRRISRLQLDTVFWATLGVGGLLALVVALLSLGSHLLFPAPEVAPLLRALCLCFVLNSLNAVPWVVLSRLLRFRTEFVINICTVTIRILAAVLAGFFGLGVWSLVVGALIGALANALLCFLCVPYRPRLRFQGSFLRGTWRTSGGYFGNTALYYINTNLDVLLIGRGLGATALGYYQNARSLTDEIRARIAMPIQHVLFPAFSAVQGEPERFRSMVLRSARLLAAIVIPIGVGVSANARELVSVLYGSQWLAMVPVMSLFGLSAALRASTAIASPLFNASNRVGLALRYNVVATLLLILAVLLTMPMGIGAVAAGVALSSLYSLLSLRAAFGLIGLGWQALRDTLAAPALASALFWLGTWGLRELRWTERSGLMLLAHVGFGAAIYLMALHLLDRRYWHEFKQALAQLRGKS